MSFFPQNRALLTQTPFGSPMIGRSWEADSLGGYRFGFNGKEYDKENNTQDYGMRIYNPALGKFLSPDPLFREFPWNSTYAFAENDVIRCIDLEGGEKLETNVTSNPDTHCPGLAKITVTLDYMVVTSDVGAVAHANKLDPDKFHDIYKSGNTTLYMKSLPTPDSEPEYLTGRNLSWARKADNAIFKSRREKFSQKLERAGVVYYKVKVEYDYKLINKGNTTLCDANEWLKEDPHGRGIVCIPVEEYKDPIRSSSFSTPNAKAAGLFYSSDPKSRDIDALGLGSNEQANGSHKNYIFLNPGNEYFLTNILAHEAGHNSAINNLHTGKGSGYEYSDSGLSSNDLSNADSLRPTQNNTNSILKDKSNRSTIKK